MRNRKNLKCILEAGFLNKVDTFAKQSKCEIGADNFALAGF